MNNFEKLKLNTERYGIIKNNCFSSIKYFVIPWIKSAVFMRLKIIVSLRTCFNFSSPILLILRIIDLENFFYFYKIFFLNFSINFYFLLFSWSITKNLISNLFSKIKSNLSPILISNFCLSLNRFSIILVSWLSK